MKSKPRDVARWKRWGLVIPGTPSSPTVAPSNYTSEGSLDEALGLPLDSSPDPAADFITLQNEFDACVGNNRPGGCTSGSSLTQMRTARREARDMILAFMAGAQPANDGSGPKRAAGGAGAVAYGEILFTAKSWVLGDSELATPAVIRAPLSAEPTGTPRSRRAMISARDMATPSGGSRPLDTDPRWRFPWRLPGAVGDQLAGRVSRSRSRAASRRSRPRR